MATNYRIVRTALRGLLAAEFQATNILTSASHGVPPLDIDFQSGSQNFIMAYLDPADFEISTAAIVAPGLALYTSRAVDLRDVKPAHFSGEVLAHMDFYLRFRALRDRQTNANDITAEQEWNAEAAGDCAEDSALQVLRSAAGKAAFAAVGAALIDFRADRDPITLYGDGFVQRVALTLGVKINVR